MTEGILQVETYTYYGSYAFANSWKRTQWLERGIGITWLKGDTEDGMKGSTVEKARDKDMI